MKMQGGESYFARLNSLKDLKLFADTIFGKGSGLLASREIKEKLSLNKSVQHCWITDMETDIPHADPKEIE